MKNSALTFSVIITASCEGILAHKTMLSIQKALEGLADYEIIVTIDNGTPETIAYFSRYENISPYRIFENKFGDVGESRNFAIRQARGKFVFFLDADDLLSENFFIKALEIMEHENREVVVHPEYCLTFQDCGAECTLQKMSESSSKEKDAFLLLSRNRWVSAMGGQKKTFVQHPYFPTGNGFGHEDYTMNIFLTEAGVTHKVAHDTVYFYRRKRVSLLTLNSDNFNTQPYSDLFSTQYWKSMHIPKADFPEFAPRTIKQYLRDRYVRVRSHKIPNFFITPLATLAKKISGKKIISTEIPPAVLDAWAKVAKIEPQIYPVKKLTDTLTGYTTENYSLVSEAYWKMCQQIEGMPDYVFVAPWLVSGGSDKVLLHYLEALKEIHPQWRIAVITTIPAENEWKNKMPSNSYLVEFGNITKDLMWDDQELLFTRLIVQLKTKKLHIINSQFAYAWVRLHQELVKGGIELFISLFCHGILSGTNGEGIWDFADPDAARIYHLVRRIYTDNTAVRQKLAIDNGFDEKKIIVHHQPVELNRSSSTKREKDPCGRLRVLWASRISVQKNPDLLLRIAKKIDSTKIKIDAYGRIDPIESEGFKFPKGLKALTYCGRFGGLSSIDLSGYDILLYTSRIDGMPNIILEAASAGLASIASNVGGVSDFVQDGQTGFLIDDVDNEDAYVKVLNELQNNPQLIEPVAKAAKRLAEKKFSWGSYIKTIRKDF